MTSVLKKNEHNVVAISVDIVFLRGASQENLKILHKLIAAILSQLSNRVQVWIENAEFLRLWKVPDDLLIKSFDDKVFVKDGWMFFRKQNLAQYIFNQHYQIVICCPKRQSKLVTSTINRFRQEESTRTGIIITANGQSPAKLAQIAKYS
jgi:hypothetical protein